MVSTGRRQIGSTIKPFLYTYAMEEGYTPCDEFLNEQPTIYDENGNPSGTAKRRIRACGRNGRHPLGAYQPNNWISARLMSQLSPHACAQQCTTSVSPTISTRWYRLCLGPCDVSVKEMVTAYSAFANNGMRVDPCS